MGRRHQRSAAAATTTTMAAAARIAVLSLSLFFTPRYYHCCSAQQADDATQDGFELKQLHVVTRHGSRTTLAKDADSLAEEGGEILTPLGQKQLHDLGVWLRQTYHTGNNNNNNATDGQPPPQMLLNLGHYNPSKHRLESSNLDRTLSSANALSLGLFPSTKRASGLPSADDDDGGSGGYALYDSLLSPPPAVPVYSTAQGNDVHLRAFQNCPAFNERLQALYETDKWRDLEAANIDLLRMLARIFPEYADDTTGAVPLKSVWNVYDPIHVAVTECGTGDENDADATGLSCDALVALPTLATAVTKSEFETLEKLTEHVEHLKFGTADVAGNLLGSNLWWKILTRAAAAADSLSGGGGEFFLYSAHAPTLLGLLSALQAGPAFVEQTGGEHFVEYGSALIVEVYRDATTKDTSAPYEELYIRMRYKASDETEAIDIALKETSSSSEVTLCGAASWPDDASSIPPYCSLAKVTTWATEHTLTSEAEWCRACGNLLSDVCMSQALLVDQGSTSGGAGDGGGSAPQGGSGGVAAQPWVIGATSFAVGFLSGLVMVGLVCLGLHRRRERERERERDSTAHGSTGCDDGIGAKGGGSSAGTADGEEEGATEAHAGAIASSNGLV